MERVNTKNLSDADIEKLKEYYSRHRSNEDVTTYPMTSNTGQYYDALGHPDFTKAVKEIRKKDGTLGRPVYEPSAGITGDRAKDARLANEEMVRRFNAEDFEYTVGSNVCFIRDPNTGLKVEHTWHHHQDGKTMMAVPKSIHDTANATHIGGVQVKNAGIIGFFDLPIF